MHHSQKFDQPLKPWVAVQQDGVILTGHCTCMAGLGESCSHLTAVLFAIEAGVRNYKDIACTSKPCSWTAPSSVASKKVKSAPSAEIDFSSPKRKHASNDSKITNVNKKNVPPLSAEETYELYNELALSNSKCGILSIVPGHCQKYIPKAVDLNLPPPLPTQLYDPEYLNIPYSELLDKCDNIFPTLKIELEHCAHIEQETKKQANCKMWFDYRAGRITASKFKAAVRTNPNSPSPSLIKSIVYPQANLFSNRSH